MTNEHVVDDNATMWIYPATGGGPYTGDVIGVDAQRDLAVVRICCNSGLRALELAHATEVRLGAEVVAFGYPYRAGVFSDLSVSDGIISTIGYYQLRDSYLVQTDAAINPGNSGGPLVNKRGKVVGTVSSKVERTPDGRPIDNIGFAVASRTIRDRLTALESGAGNTPTPTPTNGQLPPQLGAVVFDGLVTVAGSPFNLQGLTLYAKVGEWLSEPVTLGDGTPDLNGFKELNVNPPAELLGQEVKFLLGGTVESTTSAYYAIIADDGSILINEPIGLPIFRTVELNFPSRP